MGPKLRTLLAAATLALTTCGVPALVPACTPADLRIVKTVVHTIDELLARCVEEHQGATLEDLKDACKPKTPEEVAAVERLYAARQLGYARLLADAGR